MVDIEAETVRGATIKSHGDKNFDASMKKIKATKDVEGPKYTDE